MKRAGVTLASGEAEGEGEGNGLGRGLGIGRRIRMSCPVLPPPPPTVLTANSKTWINCDNSDVASASEMSEVTLYVPEGVEEERVREQV